MISELTTAGAPSPGRWGTSRCFAFPARGLGASKRAASGLQALKLTVILSYGHRSLSNRIELQNEGRVLTPALHRYLH